MKIGRIVFELSYEEQQEKCFARAVNINTKERLPSYDLPLIDVAKQLLMDKLNDWVKEKTPQIISINLTLPTLEVFYKEEE